MAARTLWSELYRHVRHVAEERPRGGRRFADWIIVLTFLWAAFNHKPVSWAVQRRNWPLWSLRWIPRLPSNTTMCRRLRSYSVMEFLAAVLHSAQSELPRSLVCIIDGKPLAIGGGSKDRQAGYGRAVGGKAMGYKLHAMVHQGGRVECYRVAPMNVPEQRMAQRLLRDSAAGPGYVLADGNYDSAQLFALTALGDSQLVAGRRHPGAGLGHRRQRPARLRSLALTDSGSAFGQGLVDSRDQIERYFGNLSSFESGLGPLPAWVRTHRRVSRWITAKLAINAARICLRRARRVA